MTERCRATRTAYGSRSLIVPAKPHPSHPYGLALARTRDARQSHRRLRLVTILLAYSVPGGAVGRWSGQQRPSWRSRSRVGCGMSMQPRPWPKVPELTARVARAVAARGPYSLAMRVRDELGELFADAEFAEAFEARGRPGWSPGQLALVTVLQFTENLTDRAAAHRVRYGMDLKYALGLELDDPGFDASVLSEFRTRLVEHGLAGRAGGAGLRGPGLAGPGGACSGMSRTLRPAHSLLASAGFHEQARRDGPGLRPGRVRAAGGGARP